MRRVMVVCVMVVVAVSMSYGTTVVVEPTEWGTVNSANPDTSYWEETGNTFIGMQGQSNGNQRFFVKFVLPPEIGPNSNITSVQFSIAGSDPWSDAGLYGVLNYVPDDSWNSTLNWNNQPGVSGENYKVDISYGWADYYSEELVGMFSEGGGEVVSMRLRCSVENVPFAYDWIRQGSARLIIEYVPEPATMVLLCPGMLGLVRRR